MPNNPNRKREGPKLSFEMHGERYEIRPDNSALFLHEEERYDHIYFNQNNEWWRIFRTEMSNFDSISEFMQSNGFKIYAKDVPLQPDFEAYHRAYGWDPIPELDPITPRQESRIKFAHYLMDNMVTVEDLFNDGRD